MGIDQIKEYIKKKHTKLIKKNKSSLASDFTPKPQRK
jgi:hypothetical protein